ncbi:MAG: hypothetical protein II431_08695, partial [Prevotella sp.]|nr:hypothetical protein [Prevotella sp.]
FEDGTDLKKIAILMQNYPQTRFKFSSLEQNIINEEFLQTLKNTPNFAPHPRCDYCQTSLFSCKNEDYRKLIVTLQSKS